MMPISIRTYHFPIDKEVPPNQFFILAKGNNAGKPGLKPWTNSFVVTCSNEEMRDFYFWLTYGLYKVKSFKVIHRGSVIQYVNVKDLMKVIMEAAVVIYPSWQEFKDILRRVELLEKRKNTIVSILKNTTDIQELLIRNYFQQQGIKT